MATRKLETHTKARRCTAGHHGNSAEQASSPGGTPGSTRDVIKTTLVNTATQTATQTAVVSITKFASIIITSSATSDTSSSESTTSTPTPSLSSSSPPPPLPSTPAPTETDTVRGDGPSAGAIAGGVVGAVGAIALVAGGIPETKGARHCIS
ncbi:hypothetical protein BST61_g5495 [Cercospora zeina]